MQNETTAIRLASSKFCTLTPNGIIEIQFDARCGEVYRIALDETDTLYKLQSWIRQLADRDGYTDEVIGDFVIFHARLCIPFHEQE